MKQRKKIIREYNVKCVNVKLIRERSRLKYHARLDSPSSVASELWGFFSRWDRELCIVINVNAKMYPINYSIVSIGDLSSCIVSPREVFKSSILSNAYGIVLAHNHPSGCSKPSLDDIRVTRRMKKALDIIGVSFIDHIILGDTPEEYYSFLFMSITGANKNE